MLVEVAVMFLQTLQTGFEGLLRCLVGLGVRINR
jgi:hypothetical protein